MKDEEDIIGMCNAYEQGYGHGYQLRTLPNPYELEDDFKAAWDYGYLRGRSKRIDHDTERDNYNLNSKKPLIS